MISANATGFYDEDEGYYFDPDSLTYVDWNNNFIFDSYDGVFYDYNYKTVYAYDPLGYGYTGLHTYYWSYGSYDWYTYELTDHVYGSYLNLYDGTCYDAYPDCGLASFPDADCSYCNPSDYIETEASKVAEC